MTKALKAVVDNTSEQVSAVQTCLSEILPPDGASKLERALKALKSLAKEDKVQQALEKIHKNNNVLVLHQTIRHVDTGDCVLEELSKLSVVLDFFLALSDSIPHHSHDSSEHDSTRWVKPEPSTSHKARRGNNNPPRTSTQRLTILVILIQVSDLPKSIHRCKDQSYGRCVHSPQSAQKCPIFR